MVCLVEKRKTLQLDDFSVHSQYLERAVECHTIKDYNQNIYITTSVHECM